MKASRSRQPPEISRQTLPLTRRNLLLLFATPLIAACSKKDEKPDVPPDILQARIKIRDLSRSPGITDEPLAPQAFATLDKRFVPECSGFAVSRRHPNTIWTHSDSDNPATLVAIRPDGSIIKPPDAPANYRGITVKGVKNIDWEAIAVTADGEFIIGDVGNNNDHRRDLRLLTFPEPNPHRDTTVTPHIFPVRHRDQRIFKPKSNKHYDCEAMFVWNDALYFLTKRWSDTWTVLCKLEPETTAPAFAPAGQGRQPAARATSPLSAPQTPAPSFASAPAPTTPHGAHLAQPPPTPSPSSVPASYGEPPALTVPAAPPTGQGRPRSILPRDARRGVLVPVGAFDARGLVTDAAIAPSGTRLAILTYHNIWLFQLPQTPLPDTPDAPISGAARCLPLRFPLATWQAEALAFDGENHLLIGTEQAALFRIPIPPAK